MFECHIGKRPLTIKIGGLSGGHGEMRKTMSWVPFDYEELTQGLQQGRRESRNSQQEERVEMEQ